MCSQSSSRPADPTDLASDVPPRREVSVGGMDPAVKGPVTDSPLFWFPVFLAGALIALVLMSSKYRWRQPQLERNYQARELSGQIVGPVSDASPLSQTGQARLTLRPLFLFFSSVLAVSVLTFWWWRFSGRYHFGKKEPLARRVDSMRSRPATESAKQGDSHGERSAGKNELMD